MNFNEELFLKDFENSNLSGSSDNPHDNVYHCLLRI